MARRIRQDILVDCAQNCSTFGPADCNGDAACLCTKQKYAHRIACCVYTHCSVEEQIPLWESLDTACKDAGIDLRFEDRCFLPEAEAARSSMIALATGTSTLATTANPSTTLISTTSTTPTPNPVSASTLPSSSPESTGTPRSTVIGLSIGLPLLFFFAAIIVFFVCKAMRRKNDADSDAIGKVSPTMSFDSEMYLHKRTSVLVTEEPAPLGSPRSWTRPGTGNKIFDGSAKLFGTTATAAKRLTGRYG